MATPVSQEVFTHLPLLVGNPARDHHDAVSTMLVFTSALAKSTCPDAVSAIWWENLLPYSVCLGIMFFFLGRGGGEFFWVRILSRSACLIIFFTFYWRLFAWLRVCSYTRFCFCCCGIFAGNLLGVIFSAPPPHQSAAPRIFVSQKWRWDLCCWHFVFLRYF